MDQNTKAAAALTLIRHALAIDDQDAFDFMSEHIEGSRLYLAFADDDGKPLETMNDFSMSLQAESPGKCACIPAASGGHRRLTPEERYAQRQAANRAGR